MDEKREAAASASAPDAPSAPDLLAVRRRRRVLPKVTTGLAVLGAFFLITNASRPKPPALAADCAKPAFALSAESVKESRPVWYTIVGPDTKRYVLGVNTAGFVRRADGGYDAVPVRGRENAMIVAAGVKPMKGCRRTGYFGLPVPPGTHEVTLYELTDAGTVAVERRNIEVTS
jgi:hypothetical protein